MAFKSIVAGSVKLSAKTTGTEKIEKIEGVLEQGQKLADSEQGKKVIELAA